MSEDQKKTASNSHAESAVSQELQAKVCYTILRCLYINRDTFALVACENIKTQCLE